MIRTKKAELIPFELNETQRLYEELNPKLKAFKGNREIILKARQLGFTTYLCGKLFRITTGTPYTSSVIIAQDETTSKKVFNIIKRMLDNLPKDLKPKVGTYSSDTIVFPDLDSQISVLWAGSAKAGRSQTYNNVLCTEVAFWENPEEIIKGLLQTVPIEGNIFIESTANGIGNYFYKEYMDAMEKNSIFTDRFFPWFINSEYEKTELFSGEVFVPTPEELEIQELYSLATEQLIWRRDKVIELRNASKSSDTVSGDFAQEYPSTPMEAFITTGASVFDKKVLLEVFSPLAKKPKDSTPPAMYSNIAGLPAKHLSIYERPMANKRYVISADVSEGIASEKDRHDNSCADVIDVDTWEQVAHIHGKWEPTEFARILDDIGRWYNGGLLVVERNNHGHAVLGQLINVLGYPKDYDNEKIGKFGGVYHYIEPGIKVKDKRTLKPGFHSNIKTKPMIISNLATAIVEQACKPNHPGTIKECTTYTKLPGNKYGGVGSHDDRVISFALGIWVLSNKVFAVPAKTVREARKFKFKSRGRLRC